MKKNYRALLLLLTLLFALTAFASAVDIPADRQLPLLVDNADLLTDEQEASLLAKLDSISANRACDVAILTVNSLEGYTNPNAYADDFYDYFGFGSGSGDDGILFLISMEERDWAISTHAFAITAFPDEAQEIMVNEMLPALSSGDYVSAFHNYADRCDTFLEMARNGTPYGHQSFGQVLFSPLRIIIAIGLGLLIGWLTLRKHINALTSVAAKQSASDYVKTGSLNLTSTRDVFLYTTRSVVPRQTSSGGSRGGGSSTHVSASGRTHGGSHGKF